jgi:thiamine-phosphate pyrophosphorylase
MRKVAKTAQRRHLTLVIAGDTYGLSRAATHNRRGTGLRTASAHTRREAIAAVRAGADAVFVSPVFATRSHPGARALGQIRFALMVQGLAIPVIALGGMTPRRARRLQWLGASGWAAIDAWQD